MYTSYFNAIKSVFNDQLSAVKTIDWYDDQYGQNKPTQTVVYPAAYIEFEDVINWQDAGNKAQMADTKIVFHVVESKTTDSSGSTPESTSEDSSGDSSTKPTKSLPLQVHHVFHGKSLSSKKKNLSTALTRIQSQLITTDDSLEVTKLTYRTTLLDDSSMPSYRKVKADLQVNTG